MAAAARRFDDFQDWALYGPDHGFYATRGGAGGRRGDFITSPEVGPLFGAVLARAVHRWWSEAGEPADVAFVEVGAGRGALAASVLAAGLPEPMGYIAVERSAALRGRAEELIGGRAEVRAELPPGPLAGVVVANELLDNVATRVLELTADGWADVWVRPEGVRWQEELRPAPEVPMAVSALDVPVGTRLPAQDRAAAWVSDVRSRLDGRLVVVDYGARSTAELVGRDWLRTYRAHGRGTDPYESPGSADITADVAFDQLPEPLRLTTQAEWLASWGIDELVEEGRRIWADRAAIGDLAAVAARSRVREAEALCDPAGLGAFLVGEWSGVAAQRWRSRE